MYINKKPPNFPGDDNLGISLPGSRPSTPATASSSMTTRGSTRTSELLDAARAALSPSTPLPTTSTRRPLRPSTAVPLFRQPVKLQPIRRESAVANLLSTSPDSNTTTEQRTEQKLVPIAWADPSDDFSDAEEVP